MATRSRLKIQEPADADVTSNLATVAPTVNPNDDHWEAIILSDPDVDGSEVIPVAAAPSSGAYGLPTRNIPGGTQAVSVASLPLPTGAATQATLASVLTQLNLLGTEAKLEAIRALVAGTLAVSGPLTDTQLRATAVPVSGPVTDTQLRASAVPVSGPVTDTQLRASAVPISAAALPLPTGAATETTLGGVLTTSDFDSKVGALTESAPATDISSSGLNGRLQRIAQRQTSLIALLPSALVGGRLDVNIGASPATVPTAPAAGENHLGEVGGRIVPITATKTRTADANAYAANDCINNATSGAAVLTFTGAARISGGSGFIVGAIASVNVAAEVEILELDLYTTAPAAIVADNAELTQLTADNAKYLGTITFPALAKKTANSTEAKAQDLSLRIPYSCSGSANLIAMIRTLSVFTPTSGAIYTFTLMCAQN